MSNTADLTMQISKPSHSSVEDMLAMIIATFIISFGMMLMQQSGTLTGGTAGLSLLIHYITGIKFGVVFLPSTCHFIIWPISV